MSWGGGGRRNFDIPWKEGKHKKEKTKDGRYVYKGASYPEFYDAESQENSQDPYSSSVPSGDPYQMYGPMDRYAYTNEMFYDNAPYRPLPSAHKSGGYFVTRQSAQSDLSSSDNTESKLSRRKPCIALAVAGTVLVILILIGVGVYFGAVAGSGSSSDSSSSASVEFNAELRMTGVTWDPDLANPNSAAYTTLEGQVLSDLNTIFGASSLSGSYQSATVNGFSAGSVICTTTLKFTSGSSGTSGSTVTADDIKTSLTNNKNVTTGPVSSTDTAQLVVTAVAATTTTETPTTAPATTTGAQATTTVASATTTGAQATTTGAQATTNGAQATTTGAQATTTGAQATITAAPVTTTGAQAITTAAPVTTTIGSMPPTTATMTTTTGSMPPTTATMTTTTGSMPPTTATMTTTTGSMPPTTGTMTTTTGSMPPTTATMTTTTGSMPPTSATMTTTTGSMPPTSSTMPPTNGTMPPPTNYTIPPTNGTMPTTTQEIEFVNETVPLPEFEVVVPIDQEFNKNLENSSSEEYLSFSQNITNGMDKMYENDTNYNHTEIKGYTNGSINVNMVIVFNTITVIVDNDDNDTDDGNGTAAAATINAVSVSQFITERAFVLSVVINMTIITDDIVVEQSIEVKLVARRRTTTAITTTPSTPALQCMMKQWPDDWTSICGPAINEIMQNGTDLCGAHQVLVGCLQYVLRHERNCTAPAIAQTLTTMHTTLPFPTGMASHCLGNNTDIVFPTPALTMLDSVCQYPRMIEFAMRYNLCGARAPMTEGLSTAEKCKTYWTSTTCLIFMLSDDPLDNCPVKDFRNVISNDDSLRDLTGIDTRICDGLLSNIDDSTKCTNGLYGDDGLSRACGMPFYYQLKFFHISQALNSCSYVSEAVRCIQSEGHGHCSSSEVKTELKQMASALAKLDSTLNAANIIQHIGQCSLENQTLADVCDDGPQLMWRSSACIIPVLEGEKSFTDFAGVCSYLKDELIPCTSKMLVVGGKFCPQKRIADHMVDLEIVLRTLIPALKTDDDISACFNNLDQFEVALDLYFQFASGWNTDLEDETSVFYRNKYREFKFQGEMMMRDASIPYIENSLDVISVSQDSRKKRATSATSNSTGFMVKAEIYVDDAELTTSKAKEEIKSAMDKKDAPNYPLFENATLVDVVKRNEGQEKPANCTDLSFILQYIRNECFSFNMLNLAGDDFCRIYNDTAYCLQLKTKRLGDCNASDIFASVEKDENKDMWDMVFGGKDPKTCNRTDFDKVSLDASPCTPGYLGYLAKYNCKNSVLDGMLQDARQRLENDTCGMAFALTRCLNNTVMKNTTHQCPSSMVVNAVENAYPNRAANFSIDSCSSDVCVSTVMLDGGIGFWFECFVDYYGYINDVDQSNISPGIRNALCKSYNQSMECLQKKVRDIGRTCDINKFNSRIMANVTNFNISFCPSDSSSGELCILRSHISKMEPKFMTMNNRQDEQDTKDNTGTHMQNGTVTHTSDRGVTTTTSSQFSSFDHWLPKCLVYLMKVLTTFAVPLDPSFGRNGTQADWSDFPNATDRDSMTWANGTNATGWENSPSKDEAGWMNNTYSNETWSPLMMMNMSLIPGAIMEDICRLYGVTLNCLSHGFGEEGEKCSPASLNISIPQYFSRVSGRPASDFMRLQHCPAILQEQSCNDTKSLRSAILGKCASQFLYMTKIKGQFQACYVAKMFMDCALDDSTLGMYRNCSKSQVLDMLKKEYPWINSQRTDFNLSMCMNTTDKPTDKPGQCPYLAPGTFGTCNYECSDDMACSGNKKCCSNGCGMTCQDPEPRDVCSEPEFLTPLFTSCFNGSSQVTSLQYALGSFNYLPKVQTLLTKVNDETCSLLSSAFSCLNSTINDYQNQDYCSKGSAVKTLLYFTSMIGINATLMNTTLNTCAAQPGFWMDDQDFCNSKTHLKPWLLSQCLGTPEITSVMPVLFGSDAGIDAIGCSIGRNISRCAQNTMMRPDIPPYFHCKGDQVLDTLDDERDWFDSLVKGLNISQCFFEVLDDSEAIPINGEAEVEAYGYQSEDDVSASFVFPVKYACQQTYPSLCVPDSAEVTSISEIPMRRKRQTGPFGGSSDVCSSYGQLSVANNNWTNCMGLLVYAMTENRNSSTSVNKNDAHLAMCKLYNMSMECIMNSTRTKGHNCSRSALKWTMPAIRNAVNSSEMSEIWHHTNASTFDADTCPGNSSDGQLCVLPAYLLAPTHSNHYYSLYNKCMMGTSNLLYQLATNMYNHNWSNFTTDRPFTNGTANQQNTTTGAHSMNGSSTHQNGSYNGEMHYPMYTVNTSLIPPHLQSLVCSVYEMELGCILTHLDKKGEKCDISNLRLSGKLAATRSMQYTGSKVDLSLLGKCNGTVEKLNGSICKDTRKLMLKLVSQCLHVPYIWGDSTSDKCMSFRAFKHCVHQPYMYITHDEMCTENQIAQAWKEGQHWKNVIYPHVNVTKCDSYNDTDFSEYSSFYGEAMVYSFYESHVVKRIFADVLNKACNEVFGADCVSDSTEVYDISQSHTRRKRQAVPSVNSWIEYKIGYQFRLRRSMIMNMDYQMFESKIMEYAHQANISVVYARSITDETVLPELNCSDIHSIILHLNNTCKSVNFLNTTDTTSYCKNYNRTLLCAKLAFSWKPYMGKCNDSMMVSTIQANQEKFTEAFGGNYSTCNACNVYEMELGCILTHFDKKGEKCDISNLRLAGKSAATRSMQYTGSKVDLSLLGKCNGTDKTLTRTL
ncbi:WAP four-disulfide core domain protein 18 [Mizuhopecten yessoensis]|uniref:WAP four-disulfide core domain protein 18 n=1 Tax=Mizuhopecten yessoensis TaxID=6573 RepID=A0A210QSS2_MIZYE|nr:WAP four-disulfide core domain protein 18 [Mizuhopecten yessoensis]